MKMKKMIAKLIGLLTILVLTASMSLYAFNYTESADGHYGDSSTYEQSTYDQALTLIDCVDCEHIACNTAHMREGFAFAGRSLDEYTEIVPSSWACPIVGCGRPATDTHQGFTAWQNSSHSHGFLWLQTCNFSFRYELRAFVCSFGHVSGSYSLRRETGHTC